MVDNETKCQTYNYSTQAVQPRNILLLFNFFFQVIISKPLDKNLLLSTLKLPVKTGHPFPLLHPHPSQPVPLYPPVHPHPSDKKSKNLTPTETPSLTPMTPPTGTLLSTPTEPNSNPQPPPVNPPLPPNKEAPLP